MESEPIVLARCHFIIRSICVSHGRRVLELLNLNISHSGEIFGVRQNMVTVDLLFARTGGCFKHSESLMAVIWICWRG